MKKLFLFCFVLLALFLAPVRAPAQWIQTSATQANIYCIASNGNTVFAGSDSGILVSPDNGGHWTYANNGLTTNLVYALITIEGNIIAGTQFGVFLSTDNGGHWASDTTGMGNQIIESFTLHNGSVFAGTATAGIYRSGDGGRTWDSVRNGLPLYANIPSMAAASFTLFAVTPYNVYLSSNDGTTWIQCASKGLLGDGEDYLALNGASLFVITDSGLFRSLDNGGTWTASGYGLFETSALGINNFFEANSILLAGVCNEGGYGGKMYLSKDDGNTWDSVISPFGNTVIHSLDTSGGYLIVGTYLHGIWRRSFLQLLSNAREQTASVTQTMLAQNYPNPFSSTTTISFYLPQNENVSSLKVYDALGREVADLSAQARDPLSSPLSRGTNIVFNASHLPAGVYYYRLTAGKEAKNGMMTMLR